MRNVRVLRRRIIEIYILSLVILIFIALQIGILILKGGWFRELPEVEIRAKNTFSRTLRVVGDVDFAPYSSVGPDGSYTGHDIECINEIANRLGVNVQVNLMTWTKATEAVKNKEADIVMGLESLSNRQDGLMITSILANDAFVVYSRKPISGVADLKSGRLATINGNTEVDIYGIEEDAIVYDTFSEELEALEQGEVDFAIIRLSVAKMLIQKNRYTDLIQVFDMMDSSLGLGVRSDQEELAAELNEVIGSMYRDGTLNSLRDKWLTTYVQQKSFSAVLKENTLFYLITCIGNFISIVLILFLLQKERTEERELLVAEKLAISHAELTEKKMELVSKKMEIAEKDAELARKNAELADGRSRIMLSQMQPHFMFNVLGTIGHLCRKDPLLASEAIDTFARYLRTNISSVRNTELVSFGEELTHVKSYIWLEKMRFGEELKVEYDIRCTHFRLPALTLQPIVENAVKHGLGNKEDGGTVIIRTEKKGAFIEISVEDDGVGFDENKLEKDGLEHIGIENVKNRLEYMCGGRLEIHSVLGQGTKIQILIPMKEESVAETSRETEEKGRRASE